MNPEPWTWTRTDFDSLSCKVGEGVEVATVGDHKFTGTLVSVSRLSVSLRCKTPSGKLEVKPIAIDRITGWKIV